HSRVDATRFANSILQHNRSCRDDGIAVHDAIIHHNRSHSNQYIVVNRAAVDDSIVTYRYIVADSGACSLVGAMNHRSVLHVYFVSHSDEVYIAPHHGIEPDAAIITHDYIANNS